MINFIPQISTEEAKSLINSKECIMIDVRRPEERSIEYIPETDWIILSELNEEILQKKEITKVQKIILQCRSGVRSQAAAEAMKEWGYPNVLNLSGGILRWKEIGYETIIKTDNIDRI